MNNFNGPPSIMLKAILLDLDNTMVIFDETAFYLRFMERIVPYFDDLVPADQFRTRLLYAIRHLLKNRGEKSNQAFFLDAFCDGLDGLRQQIWTRFTAFYDDEYDLIEVERTSPSQLADVIDQLAAWDLLMVVATNPIFPLVAQEKRLAWSGLDPGRFTLMTHMGNMSYVKPRPAYYQQICDMIGVPPEGCLMVGNDAVNDMAAGDLGITTFLTTEADPGNTDYSRVTNGRNERAGQKRRPDFSGRLADILPVVETLRGQ